MCDIPFVDPCPDFQHTQGLPMQRQACQKIQWFCFYYADRSALWLHVWKLPPFTSQSVLSSFTITLTWGPSWSLSLPDCNIEIPLLSSNQGAAPSECTSCCPEQEHFKLLLHFWIPLTEAVLRWAFGDIVQSNIKTLDFLAEEGRQPTFSFWC